MERANGRTIMLLTTGRAQMELADDEVVHLGDACESTIEVLEGFAWITIDGDRQDLVLGAGETYVVDTSDKVIVSALRGTARIAVRASGQPACRADATHAIAAQMRRAAKPSRLRGLLASVSLSSVAFA
jgi:hypothetical protein